MRRQMTMNSPACGLYEYVDETSIDPDLICSICREACRDAQCTACEHLFCLQCITTWQRNSFFSCPNCRRRLARTDLRPASAFIVQMIDELKVKCKQCGRTDLSRTDIDEHHHSSCLKTIVSCSTLDKRCPWTGQRDQLDEHMAHCLCTSFASTIEHFNAVGQQYKTEITRIETKHEANERALKSLIEDVNESISATKEMRNIDVSTLKSKLHECQRMAQSTAEQLNALQGQVETMEVDGELHQQNLAFLDEPFEQNDIRIKNLTRNMQLMHELLLNNDHSQLDKDLLEQNDSRAINLSRRHLTDQDMSIIVQHLWTNTQCQELDLRENLISDEGIATFILLLIIPNTLKKVYLGKNSLHDAGIAHLVKALSVPDCHLIELQLDGNDITDQGARSLANMLKTNKTLENLSLNGNRLSEKGMQSLVEVLIDQNRTLQELHLSDNQLTSELPVNTIIRMIQFNSSLRRFTVKNANLSEENQIKLQQVAKYKTNFSLYLN